MAKLNRHKGREHSHREMLSSEEIDQMLSIEETERIIDKEFNPVKKELQGMSAKELLHQFGSYYATSEKSFYDCIDPFLEEFNPVKIENEEPQLEQPKIKTTPAFDNSRLEFLRMQIGPVQNFYLTLENILVSLSTRVDALHEEVLKHKIKQGLYEDYLKYTVEQNRVVTLDEFFDYIKVREEKVRQEREASKK